ASDTSAGSISSMRPIASVPSLVLSVPPALTLGRVQRRNCRSISPRLMASSTSRLISTSVPEPQNARERLAEVVALERLFEGWRVRKFVVRPLRPIAGGEDEGNLP